MTTVVKTEKGVGLHDHEIANRLAPGGRMPIKGAKNTVAGEPRYTPIGDATPAAIAAAQERHETRAKPALVAKRAARGEVMGLESKFPAGSPYGGFKIDVNDARYKEHHALAEAAGLRKSNSPRAWNSRRNGWIARVSRRRIPGRRRQPRRLWQSPTSRK